ncbi:KdsC family phosphatase [Mitsuokella sp.]|uniref:KdsC family phosphatase n=1 Tax=Mitsuokella TaxID=52225 RepID=UPI0029E16DD7|nr:HAD hydrolase family protein [Mitsuokella sp.]MDD6382770.1 HAD hydrolase family protein [Selenomonadaceae bacterium]MDY4473819.1 HAD hydrolase family protein [Mitsuokella sp.]
MEFTAEAIDCAKKVRLIIFDVDGVLTDGGIYVGTEGELFKPFFCRDGLGITIAHRSGLKTAIITGRESQQLLHRAQELHITEVFQGKLDKRSAYRELKKRLNLADEEIAYFGDDLVDLAVMCQVGFPAAVGDAVPEVRAAAVAVSGFPGGHGAVRELIEFILKAQGKWQSLLDDFKALDEADGLAQ